MKKKKKKIPESQIIGKIVMVQPHLVSDPGERRGLTAVVQTVYTHPNYFTELLVQFKDGSTAAF